MPKPISTTNKDGSDEKDNVENAAKEDKVKVDTTVIKTIELKQSASAKRTFDAFMKRLADQEAAAKEGGDGKIPLGTKCTNKGCTVAYKGEDETPKGCCYHPGNPLFHEGMKSWTCCDRKTSDFQNFLNQTGCKTGEHCWIPQQQMGSETRVECRHDHFQTDAKVTLSLFAKNVDPAKSTVEIKADTVCFDVVFEKYKRCQKTILLSGFIDIQSCKAEVLGTKIEVTLPKLQPKQWAEVERAC